MNVNTHTHDTNVHTPRVTVVMAVYNAAPFLHQAVKSVLGQAFKEFELIAVDDGSSDSSFSILQSIEDPRVRILRHPQNLGAAVSRNHAIETARGEFIAIMDADDLCAPSRFEQQVCFLQQHQNAGVVGCGVYDNIDSQGRILHTCFAPQHNDTIQQALLKDWCLLHSSLMFRKSLWQRVGGYRREFEPVEDHDFVLRVAEHCEIHNIGEKLVSYRLNPKGLTVTGHEDIRRLRRVAIESAEQRRAGRPESPLPATVDNATRRLKRNVLSTTMRAWNDSLFAANRYHGFGCLELSAGHKARALRCFTRSLRTNPVVAKSWIGILASLPPLPTTISSYFLTLCGQNKESWTHKCSNIAIANATSIR